MFSPYFTTLNMEFFKNGVIYGWAMLTSQIRTIYNLIPAGQSGKWDGMEWEGKGEECGKIWYNLEKLI